MKKLRLMVLGFFASLLLLGVFLQPAVFAGDSPDDLACEGAAAQTDYCISIRNAQDSDRILGPSGILTTITQVIVLLVGVASVIMIIIGGLRYVLSGGDSNGTAGAKNTILYALIGLVVALFCQVIVSFVLSRL